MQDGPAEAAHTHRHGHGHSHGHGHGHHHHAHGPASFGRAFAIGTTANLLFVFVEAAAGLLGGSMALVADAGHNLGDVLGLAMAWAAAVLARRGPSGRYTYGWGSSSILAALLNALLLLGAMGAIAVEAVGRFFHPASAPAGMMMLVAAAGILVNGGTALLFARGRTGDLNLRGAFLHMLADAVVSAGVVLAGLLIALTGQDWIDPAVSLVIVGVIGAGTWGLLRDSLDMSLHAAPAGIDPEAVREFLQGRSGVAAVHDLHVWPMSTTDTALTAHLVMPAGFPGDAFQAAIAAALRERFGIGHATLQIETGGSDAACLLEPDHVV